MNNNTVAYFAGGCFWCIEAAFLQLKGVQEVSSGYMGGTIKNPTYKEVCTEKTGHAEVVRILFDSSVIPYQTLLYVFFSVHDPTTLNRQENDKGTQYRSAIFYRTEKQKEMAIKVIEELQSSTFTEPIVTEISPEVPFYHAEKEHENYYNQNQEQPYCSIVILPKIQKLKSLYSHLLKP